MDVHRGDTSHPTTAHGREKVAPPPTGSPSVGPVTLGIPRGGGRRQGTSGKNPGSLPVGGKTTAGLAGRKAGVGGEWEGPSQQRTPSGEGGGQSPMMGRDGHSQGRQASRSPDTTSGAARQQRQPGESVAQEATWAARRPQALSRVTRQLVPQLKARVSPAISVPRTDAGVPISACCPLAGRWKSIPAGRTLLGRR